MILKIVECRYCGKEMTSQGLGAHKFYKHGLMKPKKVTEDT